MVVAQKLKEAEITEQDSLLLTRNLLRIAIFNISYIRGLFPEKYFNDKQVPALEMKIKKLMPMDAESRRLIDWMEKGVYDALQKKYLQKLLFCICETVEGPMIEEYTFSFTYSNSDSQEVLMNINRPGNKKQGTTFKSGTTTDVTPNQMRSSACKMVRTLVQLMRTLDRMPEERTILMKLLYYDDVTPIDYEPPFFRCCAEPEANNAWTKNPLKLEVGSVNSRHLVLALKVKSVLDPCEDENGDTQDDEAASLGGSSMHEDNSSGSDSEVDHSQGEYIVAPAGKGPSEDNGIVDEEDTQDTVMDDQQLAQVRDWISSRHVETVELTDVLSNFPDISVMLTEDIMDKLIKEGVLSKAGKDIYSISNRKNFNSPLSAVKEEAEAQLLPPNGKADKRTDEDYLYMKALYHALPMDYVTIAKLQAKLEGEANQAAVRKLIDKMTHDGFLDGKGRRFGKRVIHSELTTNKLLEVKKALETKALEAKTAAMEICEYQNKSDGDDFVTTGNRKEMSTCGGFHSIGSDLTRTGGKVGTVQNDSVRSEHTTGKMWGQRNSPLSRAEMGPVASRESAVPRKQIDGQEENGRTSHSEEEGDKAICSRSSQDKRSRKASTVKEPILQYVKRQKAQVA